MSSRRIRYGPRRGRRWIRGWVLECCPNAVDEEQPRQVGRYTKQVPAPGAHCSWISADQTSVSRPRNSTCFENI